MGEPPLVRVRFNVNWSRYTAGDVYDIPATEELRQVILAGLADLIPFP